MITKDEQVSSLHRPPLPQKDEIKTIDFKVVEKCILV